MNIILILNITNFKKGMEEWVKGSSFEWGLSRACFRSSMHATVACMRVLFSKLVKDFAIFFCIF